MSDPNSPHRVFLAPENMPDIGAHNAHSLDLGAAAVRNGIASSEQVPTHMEADAPHIGSIAGAANVQLVAEENARNNVAAAIEEPARITPALMAGIIRRPAAHAVQSGELPKPKAWYEKPDVLGAAASAGLIQFAEQVRQGIFSTTYLAREVMASLHVQGLPTSGDLHGYLDVIKKAVTQAELAKPVEDAAEIVIILAPTLHGDERKRAKTDFFRDMRVLRANAIGIVNRLIEERRTTINDQVLLSIRGDVLPVYRREHKSNRYNSVTLQLIRNDPRIRVVDEKGDMPHYQLVPDAGIQAIDLNDFSRKATKPLPGRHRKKQATKRRRR